MIQPIRNLLVFGAALISILSFADNQIKKTQVKRAVSGAQMFKEYCASATDLAARVMVPWRLRLRCRRPT